MQIDLVRYSVLIVRSTNNKTEINRIEMEKKNTKKQQQQQREQEHYFNVISNEKTMDDK